MIAKTTLATTLLLALTTLLASAQDKMAGNAAAGPDMADAMVANGKIYVVVAVLATIFAGIFAYLVYLDRKITKAEQNK